MERRRSIRTAAVAAQKRVLDIIIAAGVLAATWPLILAAAAIVRLTSPGPAFYRARRAGLRARPFDMLKLRTMRTATDTEDRMITAPEDDRLTPAGRVLRRFRIDELPQFWNVLRGDMSIVGPRPEDWGIVQRWYSDEDRRTLDVRPGMVSPGVVRWYPDLMYHDPPPPGVSVQDHYLRRHLPIQIAEARWYADHQSLWCDLRVIAQAVYCVLVLSWRSPARRPIPDRPGGAARPAQSARPEGRARPA